MSNIASLKKAIKEYPPKQSTPWLTNSHSVNFVICLGAGPWRFTRRRSIQLRAIKLLKGKDLSEVTLFGKNFYDINHKKFNFYPLEWQNKFLAKMIIYLKKNNMTFNELCEKSIKKKTKFYIYKALEIKNHVKTISLFCRDSLKVESFPMDRHVKNILKKYKLPINEKIMIKLSKKINVDPRMISYGFVSSKIDKGNPDWTRKNDKSNSR